MRSAVPLAVGLVIGLLVGAALSLSRTEPDVRLGAAAVSFGEDGARSVEEVAYRKDVERLADVVVVDGVPTKIPTDPTVARLWAIVDDVWPATRRAELRQLSVFREDPRGLVGVVHPSARDGGWILSLDAADLADRSLLTETIIHELAHVVTFSGDAFQFGGEAADCDGVMLSLGCAASESTLARFANRFWPDGAPLDRSDDAFATSYGRIDASEDLAEVFVAWAENWPVEPGTTLEAKIDFLRADPDLAELRREVRVG